MENAIVNCVNNLLQINQCVVNGYFINGYYFTISVSQKIKSFHRFGERITSLDNEKDCAI